MKPGIMNAFYVDVHHSHWVLVLVYGIVEPGVQVTIVSGNGLVPDGTKPLPESMLT